MVILSMTRSRPLSREQVLITACVEALRLAAAGDQALVMSQQELRDGMSHSDGPQLLAQQIRAMGEAISARHLRSEEARRYLAQVVQRLIQQMGMIEGGGDLVGQDLSSLTGIVEQVASGGEMDSEARTQLLDGVGRLNRRVATMREQARQAVVDVQAAQERIQGLERALEEKTEEAEKDGLTGLPNRRSLDRILPELIMRCRRENQALSLIMFDIDHFKRCNDTYGHQGGDAVLSQTAKRILQEMSSNDLVARYGGEEFCIVLPNCGRGTAERVAERCRRVMAASPFLFGETRIPVTVSLGVAELTDGEDPVDLQRIRATRVLALSLI